MRPGQKRWFEVGNSLKRGDSPAAPRAPATTPMALFVIGLSLAFAALANPLDQWHWRSPLPQGNGLKDVVFGEGLFVTVGEWGTVLTSADGRNWSMARTGETVT
ncbi:MAG: hypothetical protein DME22_22875, partial [Verrucomicrobia bacterium]